MFAVGGFLNMCLQAFLVHNKQDLYQVFMQHLRIDGLKKEEKTEKKSKLNT